MIRPLHKVFWCFELVFVAALACAQNPSGGVLGTLRDSNGARIAGAQVRVEARGIDLHRSTVTDRHGWFRVEGLMPGQYQVTFEAQGFAPRTAAVTVDVGSFPTIDIVLQPASVVQTVNVAGTTASIASEPIETTSSVIKNTVGRSDLEHTPLAQRSFANIAYLTPMTEPVEPSDPTKARITAVSFGGSSGLNVDLSVDGGDNNDDYIGGFLQNYSPDAIQDFTVRTAQFDADTSRTNGGSVIISTRHGTDSWHGDAAGYFRASGLTARNPLDNPEPNPKQQFSKQDAVFAFGGPILKRKLWFFSSLEYSHENASIGYSSATLEEFHALSQLASNSLIPGVNSIDVPSSVPVPFHDTLFSTRIDWSQSERSRWFLRGAFDLNRTVNDLVQQATLPSTGATSTSHYGSVLLNQQYQFTPSWLGDFTFQGSWFDVNRVRNSDLGLALAFPFSANFHTTSGFETFGDNQFATEITAFPVMREQQKYQFRYDVAHIAGAHSPKFGVNLIHEPVLDGALAASPETLVVFPQDPSFYATNPAQFASDFNDPANRTVIPPGANGSFSQNVQRLGVYAQDSWRIRPHLTVNYGLRYDTTFGLFMASGRDQKIGRA